MVGPDTVLVASDWIEPRKKKRKDRLRPIGIRTELLV